MCTISMIYDGYGPKSPLKIEPFNWTQTYLNISYETKTALDLFEELVAKAKELDEALGLADCEDPRKGKWLEKVREVVREHEIKKIEDRLVK